MQAFVTFGRWWSVAKLLAWLSTLELRFYQNLGIQIAAVLGFLGDIWRPRRRRPRRVFWEMPQRCSTKCSSWEKHRVSVSDFQSDSAACWCIIAHKFVAIFGMMRVASVPSSGAKKVINSELWHACAGPLVCLPQRGSLVYYFPQGHSEQVNLTVFFHKLQLISFWNAATIDNNLVRLMLNNTLGLLLEWSMLKGWCPCRLQRQLERFQIPAFRTTQTCHLSCCVKFTTSPCMWVQANSIPNIFVAKCVLPVLDCLFCTGRQGHWWSLCTDDPSASKLCKYDVSLLHCVLSSVLLYLVLLKCKHQLLLKCIKCDYRNKNSVCKE